MKTCNSCGREVKESRKRFVYGRASKARKQLLSDDPLKVCYSCEVAMMRAVEDAMARELSEAELYGGWGS